MGGRAQRGHQKSTRAASRHPAAATGGDKPPDAGTQEGRGPCRGHRPQHSPRPPAGPAPPTTGDPRRIEVSFFYLGFVSSSYLGLDSAARVGRGRAGWCADGGGGDIGRGGRACRRDRNTPADRLRAATKTDSGRGKTTNDPPAILSDLHRTYIGLTSELHRSKVLDKNRARLTSAFNPRTSIFIQNNEFRQGSTHCRTRAGARATPERPRESPPAGGPGGDKQYRFKDRLGGPGPQAFDINKYHTFVIS